MSEKIVQLNEEVIKGQIKELVRGCRRWCVQRQSWYRRISRGLC